MPPMLSENHFFLNRLFYSLSSVVSAHYAYTNFTIAWSKSYRLK